jgi:hypothetical protein
MRQSRSTVSPVTHVFEMRGRTDAGIEWLESRINDWAPGNGLACHNLWHMGLFLLQNGNDRRVLDLFDKYIWPKPSSIALEMVDAASMLWRLHLHGVELGTRAASVADAWSDAGYHGYYAFNDAHAAMAFVADGRLEQARAIVAELERCAGEDGSNAEMSREVGLPLARAILAFGECRHDEVVNTLYPLRLVAHKFGGSNAQRDVIDRTLAVSAARAGQQRLVQALEAERRLRCNTPDRSLAWAADRSAGCGI